MVDKKTVEYVANLARIDIREDQKSRFTDELSRILEYIDKLKELNVESIRPTRGAFTEENVLRPDRQKKKEYYTDILNNAPASEDNHFRVPKVI
ncbi:MAG: asparaginyl/glutamyl-tRNA amidotransferase subunit C [Candidatus Omnitrophica bacterium 4484_171]|nr:MAG: asparaginyl/glutamyl-tRNA amidotransferase subunit C [Candidatus Omnitrophica bacterium 4484_171]